jgi:hypothetical protein
MEMIYFIDTREKNIDFSINKMTIYGISILNIKYWFAIFRYHAEFCFSNADLSLREKK